MMILTRDTGLRSPKLHQRWLFVTVVMLAALIAGCQPKAPAAKPEGSALPSMSGYTSARATQQPAQSQQSNPARDLTQKTKAQDSTPNAKLSAGQQYCFYKAGDQNWLGIRLQITDGQKITGESAGTIVYPEKGEARYRQTFTGEINGDQATVEVTTQIADLTENRQETWTVTPQQLDMGRIAIEKASCMKVSPIL
ncbi:MAG: hypothetical protein WBA76_04930 [Phormidesmis sp.]